MKAVDAYLAEWFSNYYCPCGAYFGPDGLELAFQHFRAGHYKSEGVEK